MTRPKPPFLRQVTSLVTSAMCGFALWGLAGASPKVGWEADSDFWVVSEHGANGFDLTLYPAGQSGKDWQQRLVIRRLDRMTAGGPLAETIDALQKERHLSCMDDSYESIAGQDVPTWVWVCPLESESGKTRVHVERFVQAMGVTYVGSGEWRGGPVAKGRVASTNKEAEERIWTFLASFRACARLTDRGCVAPEAVLGRYGEAEMTPAESAQVAQITSRGKEMYRQDQLAWHATDYANANGLLTDSAGGYRIRGYLSVAGEGRGGETYFVMGKDGPIDEVLRVDTNADGKPYTAVTLQSLPESLLMRWKARQSAAASKDLKVCSKTTNTIELPFEDGKGWLVYVMSAVDNESAVFLGGHNRVLVDAKGEQVLSVEQSAKSCIPLDAKAVRSLKPGAVGFATHLVSPLPWETDVMQSLTFSIPITRIADSGVWRIEGARMRKYALDPPAEPRDH